MQITFSVPTELGLELRALSRQQGMSISATARMLLTWAMPTARNFANNMSAAQAAAASASAPAATSPGRPARPSTFGISPPTASASASASVSATPAPAPAPTPKPDLSHLRPHERPAAEAALAREQALLNAAKLIDGRVEPLTLPSGLVLFEIESICALFEVEKEDMLRFVDDDDLYKSDGKTYAGGAFYVQAGNRSKMPRADSTKLIDALDTLAKASV